MSKQIEKAQYVSNGGPDRDSSIHPEMTLLDAISRYRATEAVFRRYDEKAGVCLCCQALFDSLKDVAEKYRLDLGELISDLERAVS